MQFLIDGVNQENKNNKNFFTLDENLLLISLKENEALKFLAKVSKEETLFSQFISNINYRGMYQLYESTKTISVTAASPSATTSRTCLRSSSSNACSMVSPKSQARRTLS